MSNTIRTLPHRQFSNHDSKVDTSGVHILVSIDAQKRHKLVMKYIANFGPKGVESIEALTSYVNRKLRCEAYNVNHIRHSVRQLAKNNFVEFSNGGWHLTRTGAARFANVAFKKLN